MGLFTGKSAQDLADLAGAKENKASVQGEHAHGGGDPANSHGLHSIVLPAPRPGALSIFVYSGMYSKLLLRYHATGLV